MLLKGLPGLLTGLVLVKLWHVIFKDFTGLGILVPFTNPGLVEFCIGYLALFCHFLVVDSSEWFWSEILRTNLELMLVFPKALYVWLYFFSTVH